jgi:hypothetical protein
VYRGPVDRKEVRAFLKDMSGLAHRTLLRQEDMSARKIASVHRGRTSDTKAEATPAPEGSEASHPWNGRSDEDFSDLSFECSMEQWQSSSLSMPSNDADGATGGAAAAVSKLAALGVRLASADRPVVVRGLAKDGFAWDLESLLAAHGVQTKLQARNLGILAFTSFLFVPLLCAVGLQDNAANAPPF